MLQHNFIKQKVLKQFRIFNGLTTRFLNAKFLKADQEKENPVSIINYAVNGALFYGKHLASNTGYKKVIAIGVSGNEKRHRISPIFIDERLNYKELPEIETFISFKEERNTSIFESFKTSQL